MMQAPDSKWSVPVAIIVIVTQHTDGDLWDGENPGADFSNQLFGLQVTSLPMYFTYYTMPQSLQDTNTVLRLNWTIAERTLNYI